MILLTTKASKVEFLKGLQSKRNSIEDIEKDNFTIFKNSDDEYTVINCRTNNREIMNSSCFEEWKKTNTSKSRHQVISYIL